MSVEKCTFGFLAVNWIFYICHCFKQRKRRNENFGGGTDVLSPFELFFIGCIVAFTC